MRCRSLLALSSILVIGLLIAVLASTGASAAAGCTQKSLQGSYGWAMSGSVFDTAGTELGDLASAGRFTFNGQGGLVGGETDSFNGQVTSVTDNGTYTVNADCTGTMTMNSSSTTFHLNIVIVDDTRQFKFVDTDPGLVLAGTSVKQ
jgi:hypothetical protein